MIEISGVTKRYSNGPEVLTVIDELNLSVREGESLVISGQSGSGKTTLLNLIGGLDKPDEGSIQLSGKEITNLDEESLAETRGRTVGFVFQFHYLLRDFDAVENVMLPAYLLGMTKREARERARQLLDSVRLSNRPNHYPHQLSGGERQRVAVARALVNDPRILLADEPTGNLDDEHSREVEEIIFGLSEKMGKTLVVVTHDSRTAGRGMHRRELKNGILE